MQLKDLPVVPLIPPSNWLWWLLCYWVLVLGSCAGGDGGCGGGSAPAAAAALFEVVLLLVLFGVGIGRVPLSACGLACHSTLVRTCCTAFSCLPSLPHFVCALVLFLSLVFLVASFTFAHPAPTPTFALSIHISHSTDTFSPLHPPVLGSPLLMGPHSMLCNFS